MTDEQIKELAYTARWNFKTIWATTNESVTKQLSSDGYDAVTGIIGDHRKVDGSFSNPGDSSGDANDVPFQYQPPTVVTTNISMPMQAGFLTSSGKAKGLVIHFTEGHTGGKDEALNTLSYLKSQGYGCLVMDESGIIYCGDLGVNARGAHAGKGLWNGISSANTQLYGIEVCNPGLVEKKGESFYYSWGDKITKSEDLARIRHVTSDIVEPGYYFTYSEAQETALINFCLWQLATNPEFKIENITGHDDYALPRGRKQDPGGSLSMTMEQFRKKVLELSKV